MLNLLKMIEVFFRINMTYTPKRKILRKTNYIQRNLNDKRSTKYKKTM